MTTHGDQTQEPSPAGATVDRPADQLPIDRLDYGDAEQLAEMTGVIEPPEEPLIVVDEPVPDRAPYDRAR